MKRVLLPILAIVLLVSCAAPKVEPVNLTATQTTAQRLTSLEKLTAAQGAEISALKSRVARLEQLVAPSPSPTPTPAPTPRPTANPIPTPTPTLRPTPTPAARTITCAAGRPCYVPQAGEVIDGWTIKCPGDQVYDAATTGIWINQPNVTVRNTTISGCGNADVWIDGATGFLLESNTFTDAAYAGVITTGATKGTIRGNLVQRVGTRGHERNANAYGIAISMWNDGIPSSDVVVDSNTIEDVPLWHCLDTHGGQRINFTGNTTRRCPRAIFVTSNVEHVELPVGTIVARNTMLEPVSGASAGGTNPVAITLYETRSTSATDNAAAAGYPDPIVYDYLLKSQGLVNAGNRRAA